MRALATEPEVATYQVAVRAAPLADELSLALGTLVDGVGEHLALALEGPSDAGEVHRGGGPAGAESALPTGSRAVPAAAGGVEGYLAYGADPIEASWAE